MAEPKFGRDFETNEPGASADDEGLDLFSTPIAIGDVRFPGTLPEEPAAQAASHQEIDGAVEIDVSTLSFEDEPMTLECAAKDPNVIADEAFETEMPILAAGALPPERVRFAVPLDIMVEGDSDLYRGAVLNLSSTGIACALPLELAPGQRIWARFKLSLGEEPLSLLCTVVWRRELDIQHVLYGIQFTNLTDSEAERILTAVRERLDGRAADWPLPVMPAEPARATTRKATSSWSSAAFGMIGGMGLALVLSALPHVFGVTAREEQEPLPSATVAEAAEPLPPSPSPVVIGAQTPADAPVAADAPAPAESALAAMEPEAPALEAPVPVIAAQVEELRVVAAKPKAEPAKPKAETLPRKSGGPSTEIALASGSALQKPHAFWLDNPRRYVVDVPGKREAKTPEAKGLVNKVRVGSYEDKTRYVLEVASNVHDARVEPRGNALIVTLSK